MESKERCELCRYYAEANIELGNGESTDICRRYPPAVMVTSDGAMRYGFALTQPTWWCGEFKAREEER